MSTAKSASNVLKLPGSRQRAHIANHKQAVYALNELKQCVDYLINEDGEMRHSVEITNALMPEIITGAINITNLLHFAEGLERE